ncbi:mitochondrial import receptor protein [Lunasporangiospora selenospora]|uniref:Mitochondrial import receptor protein n=1 Tax=Lunasporangiospora selenospora TaxID=979761 RepID=A0A9P6FT96_9FUNG|nr:mitochondrial import receptor protein [Lunasporangiospora selenospora]
MVKLEEVSADHVEEEYTDTDSTSVYSSDDEDDVDNIESILDRVWALQDVIPPKARRSIADKCSTVYDWGKYSAKFLGNSAWVLTTSALLLVLPLMIELEHEQGLIEYEKMQQQSNQMLSQPGGQQKKQTGLVPPGF